MTDLITPTRRCNICGQEFPETAEYFHRGKGNKGGLIPSCKGCYSARAAELRLAKVERYKAKGHDTPATKICTTCGNQYPATSEHFYPREESRDGLRRDCRNCFNARQKEWVAANRDLVRATGRKTMRRQRQEKGEKLNARTREWKARNKDKIQAYRDANRSAFAVYSRRRKDRIAGRLDDLTLQQWEATLAHFGDCCAYCGRPPGLFHTICIEHFIPISSPDCPGTTVYNCVPACHGVDGCNNKKHVNDPEQWILKTFGKSKGKKILQRIKDFLASVRPT